MDKYSSILNEFRSVTLDYREEIKHFEKSLKSKPLSSLNYSTDEDQILHQTQAYNLFNQYINNLLVRIDKIQNTSKKPLKNKYLKEFGSRNSLTNGKFYDYAVGHEMWREKEPRLYELIETKLRRYIELENQLDQIINKNEQ
ncbi:hypothetical protein [Marivirga harenae]|uniref:hypothetical protein n=1 Tax=Marivirga harenae TaxID=2010992 RepID=UPI0026E00CC1|nr:hypothetical protein [Marivirga harenae]WKV11817.1 hypothetical protein Q3Y49_16565 [Marivirga harenae]